MWQQNWGAELATNTGLLFGFCCYWDPCCSSFRDGVEFRVGGLGYLDWPDFPPSPLSGVCY